jgi:hypothetical protein
MIVADVSQKGLGMSENDAKAYGILLQRALSGQKSALPSISDMVRYSQLFHEGGIYIDVDINPGNIDLGKPFCHRKVYDDIPLIGPALRTRHNAKVAGYYDFMLGKIETALIKMYNYHMLGNHFIATVAQNNRIKNALNNATHNALSQKCRTGGPWDLINAIKAEQNDEHAVIANTIPPFLFDINWVSEDSDNLVT